MGVSLRLPVLILREGCIFAGVWLEEMIFPEAVQDIAFFDQAPGRRN